MFGNLKFSLGFAGPSVTPLQAQQRIQDGAIVIDVREPDEYAQGSIPNAVNVPLSRIEREGIGALDRVGIPRGDAELLIACRSGARSAKVCAQLQPELGNRVINLQGGLLAWVGAGLPIQRNDR